MRPISRSRPRTRSRTRGLGLEAWGLGLGLTPTQIVNFKPRVPGRRPLKIESEFVTSAAGAAGFPADGLLEIALVGRSNVGKSTLINALARRKLARTSAAPGKTRLANFYRVAAEGRPAFHLVDLPGYGYARGGGQSRDAFDQLAKEYFVVRAGLVAGGLAVARGQPPSGSRGRPRRECLAREPWRAESRRGHQGRQIDARRTAASSLGVRTAVLKVGHADFGGDR